MRLSKFLLVVACVTLFSLLYVYQQTEIFHLAYAGQKRFAIYQDLLDKNTILRYNRARNTSLACIGNTISKNIDYEMPQTYRLVRLQRPQKIKVSQYVPKKENILSRLFGIKREAQAKTINP